MRDEATGLTAHADDLRALAWCLARNDGADDLVQDTFVTALRSPPPRADRVRAWLRQVMRNELRMRLRRERRRHERERQLVTTDCAPALDELAAHEELVAAMTEAMTTLSDPYRSVLQARFFDGQAPSEISRVVGCPPATVRWQIHEGLRRIREQLDERYGNRQRWCGGAVALAAWPGREASRAAGVTTMGKFAILEWTLGSVAAGGALAVAITQSSAASHGDAAALAPSSAPTIVADADAGAGAAVAGDRAALDPAPAHRDAPAPAPADDGNSCDGQCDPGVPMRMSLSDDAQLAAVFAQCQAQVPGTRRDERYELSIHVAGRDDGNAITGVDVTQGRRLPCVDPDADFDEVDDPDAEHFPQLEACVAKALDHAFVDAVPTGEQRIVDAVIGDAQHAAKLADRSTWALPAPSAAGKREPEQAVAAIGERSTAPVSIIECGGYDCSFCRKAQDTLDELATRYGDELSFHFLQFPLDMHATAELAARAAIAARKQGGFWTMHEALFDHPEARTLEAILELARTQGLDVKRFEADMRAEATGQIVADEREVCMHAGAQGTPAFFINGDLVVGSQAVDAFRDVIDDELAQAGATVPPR